VNVSTTFDYNPGVLISTSGLISEGVDVSTMGYGSDGVRTYTEGDYSDGVVAQTMGANSRGININTNGLDSHGIMVTAQQGVGIETNTYSDNIWYAASSNRNFGAGNGVFGSSKNQNGIVGVTNRIDHKYGIYTEDYLYAKGTQVPNSDVAEYMPVTQEVSPGTVLVIGPEGKLQPSQSAYDTRVIGIVSTDPGVTLGTREDGNPGEALIAVAGRVPCKVDAGNGAIRPGDLLSTSDTPGYAMKAMPVNIGGIEIYKPSTVLGKAMGSLESGTGVIEVVVTLQ
jgi:hypothetical protein